MAAADLGVRARAEPDAVDAPGHGQHALSDTEFAHLSVRGAQPAADGEIALPGRVRDTDGDMAAGATGGARGERAQVGGAGHEAARLFGVHARVGVPTALGEGDDAGQRGTQPAVRGRGQRQADLVVSRATAQDQEGGAAVAGRGDVERQPARRVGDAVGAQRCGLRSQRRHAARIPSRFPSRSVLLCQTGEQALWLPFTRTWSTAGRAAAARRSRCCSCLPGTPSPCRPASGPPTDRSCASSAARPAART